MPWSLFPQAEAETLAGARSALGGAEAPTFTGIPKAVGMGLLRGGARVGEAVMLAGSAVALGVDQVAGTGLAEGFFETIHDLDLPEYWTPKPEEVGTAGRILGGLSEIVLPLAAGGGSPELLMAGQGLSMARELAKQGVAGGTAATVGTGIAAFTGAGVMIPFFGSDLAAKVVIGATGNAALGAVADKWAQDVLTRAREFSAAERFDPSHLEARAIELLTGAAFGGLAHAMQISGADRAAIATANAQKHLTVDTAPGRPVDLAASAAHLEAQVSASQQLARGEKVDVSAAIDRINFQADQATLEVRAAIGRGFEELRTELFGPEGAARIAARRELEPQLARLAALKGDEGIAALEDLYARAEARNPDFEARVRGFAEQFGAEAILPGVKARVRAVEKAVDDYAGDVSQVKDAVRATLAFDSIDEALAAVARIKGEMKVLSNRNLLTGETTIDGYRDVKLNVDLDGLTGELMVNVKPMVAAKAKLHGLYEKIRTIDGVLRSEGRDATPAEAKAIDTWRATMRAGYADAWRAAIKATAERKAASSSGVPLLTKEASEKGRSKGSKARQERPPSLVGSSATGTPSTSANRVPLGNEAGSAMPHILADRALAGNPAEAITARGERIPVGYRVVEAADLVTSHDEGMRVNPVYPAELQPRDRTRAASEEQVARMAQNLDPAQILDSPFAYTGAPIVGPDAVVESGNARTLAIRRAYREGKALGYRTALTEAAPRLGLDPQAVSGMKEPVLVRERTADVDRVRFAREANEPPVAALSVTERAKADAQMLPALEGLAFNDDGTINQAGSRRFMQGFVQHVVGPADLGAFVAPDGSISQQGLARIRNAIFARAYEDAELVQAMAESTDPIVRNAMHGLTRAAGDVAAMRAAIASGDLYPLDITPQLVAATRLYAQLRANGTPVRAYLEQGTLFAGLDVPPATQAFLLALDEHARSAKRVAEVVKGYVDEVNRLGSPKQAELLGAREIPPPEALLERAIAQASKEARTGDLFDTGKAKDPEVAAALAVVNREPGLVVPDADGVPRPAGDLLRAHGEVLEATVREAEALRAGGETLLRETHVDYGRPPGPDFREEVDPQPDAPAPGSRLIVYRLANRPELENTNAGNALGVAMHLARVDDFGAPQSATGTGNKLFAYEVEVDAFGDYDAYNAGRAAKGAVAVGRTVSKSLVWYSFPEGAKWRATAISEVPLERVRAALEDMGYRDFDESGAIVGAQAIRRAFQGILHERSGRYANPAQLELGLEHLDLTGTAPTEVPTQLRRLKGSVLAQAIAEDFKTAGATALIGKRIGSAHDLAVLAQVYRHPSFETFRAFFVDADNQIIDASAVTSRSPGSTAVIPGVNVSATQITGWFRDRMKANGAAGVWLLHNHPSGRASPSQGDLNVTQLIHNELGDRMRGHVVIDHNEWTNISYQKMAKKIAGVTYPEDLGARDLRERPVDHSALGRSIDGPPALKDLARDILHSRDADTGVLVTTDFASKVTSIVEISNAALARRDKRAAAELRRWARTQAANRIFYIGDAWNTPEMRELLGSQGKTKLFADAIAWNGNKTIAENSALGSHHLGESLFGGATRGRVAAEPLDDYARGALDERAGRRLTDSELEVMRERARRHFGAMKAGQAAGDPALRGLTDSQLRAQASDRAAAELVHQAEKQQQRAALSILAASRTAAAIRRHPGGMMRGLMSLMVRDVKDQGSTLSMEYRAEAIKATALAHIVPTLEASHPRFFGLLENTAGVRAILREIWGEDTGIREAKEGARLWGEAVEELRTRFNAAGGDIGHLEDWRIPQQWAREKVSAAGLERWVADTLPRLDRRRYFHDDGRLFTDADLADFLAHAYETIITDGFNKVLPGEYRGAGQMANRGSEHRQIHFRSPDDYIASAAQYSEAPLYGLMVGHVSGLARRIAALEVLGPNPRQMFQYLHDLAEKAGYQDHGALKTRTVFEEFLHDTQVPESETLARYGQGLRNVQVFAKLGGAMLSSVTDFATVQITAAINRLPEFKLAANQIRALNPLDRAERARARRAGLALDTLISELNRFGEEGFGAGWTGKLANLTMRVTGLSALTDANKRAYGVTVMNALGDLMGKRWAEVDAADKRLLAQKGIGETEWRVWQQARLEDWGGGNRLLTAQAVMGIDDGRLMALAEEKGTTPLKLRREAATKLLGSILEEADIAVVTPGVREKAIVKQGTRSGTIPGELMRSIFLFKSFPIGMISKHWMRGLAQPTAGGKATYLASLMVGTTVLGALAMTAKDIAAGKDPRDLTEWKTWLAAFAQGGGLGIYGDFIAQDANRFGQSFVATAAGPLIGTTLEQLYDLSLGNMHQAARGEDPHFGAEALRFVRSNLPGVNLWYTKAALDHAIFHQAQEYVSPGYLGRMQRQVMRDSGQTFWWAPGPGLPERGPDFERMAGP